MATVIVTVTTVATTPTIPPIILLNPPLSASSPLPKSSPPPVFLLLGVGVAAGIGLLNKGESEVVDVTVGLGWIISLY